MTKEEVLRGLEICKEAELNDEGCPDCPYYRYVAGCISELMGDAYSLLKKCFGEKEKGDSR